MALTASRDQNGVPTLIGVLNTDGQTITPVQASPSAHSIKIAIGTSGSDHGTVNARKDENGVSCIMAVSSVDGVTPVAVYVDSSGHLLTTTS